MFTYDTKEQKIQVDERTAQAFNVEQVQTGVPYEMVKRELSLGNRNGIISVSTKK